MRQVLQASVGGVELAPCVALPALVICCSISGRCRHTQSLHKVRQVLQASVGGVELAPCVALLGLCLSKKQLELRYSARHINCKLCSCGPPGRQLDACCTVHTLQLCRDPLKPPNRLFGMSKLSLQVYVSMLQLNKCAVLRFSISADSLHRRFQAQLFGCRSFHFGMNVIGNGSWCRRDGNC